MGEGGGGGQGKEMAQTMYAHMNKGIKKIILRYEVRVSDSRMLMILGNVPSNFI
jgi:hypothetical protein